jgi:isoleucyl-tRNA synthetase
MIAGIKESAKEAHQVIVWDEVGETEGTGIVHIAPGAGAEDFALGREYGLPIVAPLDDEGHVVDGFGWLTGMPVSDVADPIFKNLEEKGLLYHVEPYTHRYPTCWRCKTELVFRLVDEWFISMDELRPLLMDITRQIRWIPSFGLERELDWLRNMHDWMISKKRYWGLALPIWQCDNGTSRPISRPRSGPSGRRPGSSGRSAIGTGSTCLPISRWSRRRIRSGPRRRSRAPARRSTPSW